ncbi:MAG: BatA domain-containing protein [Planctomycetes bacterium]|nr:BatA domain-containing protein [Planctomycetota bacterium]
MFAQPLLLLGVILGAAPILIHLLNRRRFRTVAWAAMKFLLESQRKNNRRIRFQHLLLLILRTLILVLVPLAMARPRIAPETLAAVAASSPARHVLLLLDHSFSMSCQSGGRSPFDEGRFAAKAIVDSLREGDKVAFYLISDTAEGVVREPSYHLRAVSAEIESAVVSHGGTDIPAALKAAAEFMRDSSSPQREVYLITDFQEVGWKLSQAARDPEFLQAVRDLSRTTELVFIDVGREMTGNLAVTDMQVARRSVLVGEMTPFEVTARNFGFQDAGKAVVSFYVDNRKQGSAATRIPARDEVRLRFHYLFHDQDAHVVTATLDPDELSLDDERFLSVHALAAVRVLCVDGHPDSAQGQGEVRYIKAALAPAGSSSPFVPEVTSPSGLRPASLPESSILIMANVALLTPDSLDALEHFVREGGGLVVFLGDRVDTRFYNEKLYHEGRGLLPARLEETVEKRGDDAATPFVEPRAFEHPVLSLFQGLQATTLTSVLAWKYTRVSLPPEGSESTVICRYSSGDPALVERRYGLGRTLLVTTTGDADWTNLPQKPVFLPLVHEMAGFMLQGADPRRNLRLGESYRRFLKPPEFGGKFQVTRLAQASGDPRVEPGREEKPMPIVPAPQGPHFVLHFGETRQAGVYRVDRTDVPGGVDYFAVNVPVEESDLQRVTADRIRQTFPGLQFRYETQGSVSRHDAQPVGQPQELWKTILGAVLILVCLESILAHRFGR